MSILERSTPPSSAPAGESGRPARDLRAPWPTLAVAAGLLAFSTVLVLWARTRPGFDPFGWLVWGHRTIVGSLDTNAAPSWKPLPYLLTLPFALFGHYQLWLWMIASVAVSLSGTIFAARIAYRLVGVEGGNVWPARAAAVFAGAGVLGLADYGHYILSSQSDPMIVALCLAAIDCHLSGRPRWAYVLGVLAALGRPEVWPFLALYAIWAWRRRPDMRWLVGGGLVALLLLWFGIPALSSRSPFVAGSNALGSGRALHSNKVFGTIGRFIGLHQAALEVLAVISVAIAAWRRDKVVLVLAAGVVVWVIVEIAFALHGWPGLARYMFEAGAVMVVIAGVGVGRLLIDPQRISRAAAIGGVAVVVIALGALLPAAVSDARAEHSDIRAQRLRTDQINRLAGVIRRLGGAALLRQCGEALTRLEYQTVLAWELGENVSSIGFKYGQAIAHGNPIIMFTPQDKGWVVQAMHQLGPACSRLPRTPVSP